MRTRKESCLSRPASRKASPFAEKLADVLSAKADQSRWFFEGRGAGWRPVAAQHHRIQRALAEAESLLHGVGVGRKYVGGRPTAIAAVRFYVTQKLPNARLPQGARLPCQVGGVPTDVIEAPPAFFATAPRCSIQRRKPQRPLQPGASCAHETIAAGTIAALCRSRLPHEAGLRLLLGNSHVLALFGDSPLGASILQPAAADGGAGTDRVATLLRSAPIDRAGRNRVDAAVAAIDPAIAAEAEICGIGRVTRTAPATPDLGVVKHGRTTGLTTGFVDDPSCDFVLPLRAGAASGIRFVEQIRVRARTATSRFGQAGDSGALVVATDSRRAVGLFFACPDDGSFAYANPIDAVLTALNVELA